MKLKPLGDRVVIKMTEAEELVVAEQRLAAEEKRIAKEEEKRLRRLKTRKNRK